MEHVKQEFGSSVLPESAVLARSAFFRDARRLIFLIWVLWMPVAGHAGDAYGCPTLDRRFAEPQGSTNAARATTGGSADPNLTAVERELRAEQRIRAQGPPVPPPPSNGGIPSLTLCLLAASLLVILKVMTIFLRTVISRASAETAEEVLKMKKIFAEPTMSAFFTELQCRLNSPPDQPVVPEAIAALQTHAGPKRAICRIGRHCGA